MSVMYKNFAAALIDPIKETGAFPPRRFAVYRNNVAASLTAAMKAQFPAVLRLLGDDAFATAALGFLRAEPPHSVLLFEIGEGFAAFLESVEALARYPFIGDVARLEYEMALAQHAADVPAIEAAALSALSDGELARVAFGWHPAARLFRSEYPAVTICRQNRDGGEPQTIRDWCGEAALIVRPRLTVHVRLLPPGGFAFLAAVRDGETLAVAAERGFATSSDFDLASNIAGMFEAGAISRIHLLA